jgi:hypothetical protein
MRGLIHVDAPVGCVFKWNRITIGVRSSQITFAISSVNGLDEREVVRVAPMGTTLSIARRCHLEGCSWMSSFAPPFGEVLGPICSLAYGHSHMF